MSEKDPISDDMIPAEGSVAATNAESTNGVLTPEVSGFKEVSAYSILERMEALTEDAMMHGLIIGFNLPYERAQDMAKVLSTTVMAQLERDLAPETIEDMKSAMVRVSSDPE